MNKFQAYKQKVAELQKAREWAEKIGKMPTRCTYNSPGKISSVTMTVTICYQERDGAQNYHDAPPHLAAIMQEKWLAEARSNINAAIQEMLQQVIQARHEAVEEYQKLLDEDETVYPLVLSSTQEG